MPTAVEAMAWHPIACMFPMLSEKELADLSEDIKQHGQREDIVLFEGKVLDGRNRWMACTFAGVEPRTRDFSGSSAEALEYVWSTNRLRRHLNPGQMAIAEAERLKLDHEYRQLVEAEKEKASKGGRPKKGSDKKPVSKPPETIQEVSRFERETAAKRAKAAGTNQKYVHLADKIVKDAPDLAEKVKSGAMTLPQASTELRRQEKREQLETKAKAAVESFADQPTWTLLNQDVKEGLQTVIDHHSPARLIFADPPYNIGIQYGAGHDDDLPRAEYLRWCREWIAMCYDALSDDGSLWLMINDEYAADFVAIARDQVGMHLRSWIKWYETFGVNCANNFNRTSRHILYFVVDTKEFVFNETAALRPSDRQTKYGDTRAQSSGKILDDVWMIPRLTGTASERIPDVPTQLPIELVSRIVEIASEPGDLVVDPFNGSGTTGVATCRAHRKYVGIDISEQYIDIADKRLRGAL
jgi:site-specific DNA-methyltransferase (adenine-specific)